MVLEMASDDFISIYRAVGSEEFYDIIETNKFSIHPKRAGVKYFGKSFEETLEFANSSIGITSVAIIETIVPRNELEQIMDFTQVDISIFKSGTVIIHGDDIETFNNMLVSIIHLL